jgi:hypothetical protein
MSTVILYAVNLGLLACGTLWMIAEADWGFAVACGFCLLAGTFVAGMRLAIHIERR